MTADWLMVSPRWVCVVLSLRAPAAEESSCSAPTETETILCRPRPDRPDRSAETERRQNNTQQDRKQRRRHAAGQEAEKTHRRTGSREEDMQQDKKQRRRHAAGQQGEKKTCKETKVQCSSDLCGTRQSNQHLVSLQPWTHAEWTDTDLELVEPLISRQQS